MDALLSKALQQPVDTSPGFFKKVQGIRGQISREVGLEVELDADMNYRAGQRISLHFNERAEVVGPLDNSGVIELSLFISSRGPYYTYVVRCLKGPSFDYTRIGLPQPKRVWDIVGDQDDKLPKTAMTAIDLLMRMNSYVLLEGPILSQIVNGKYTDLDGKPASVFEVLFSEID